MVFEKACGIAKNRTEIEVFRSCSFPIGLVFFLMGISDGLEDHGSTGRWHHPNSPRRFSEISNLGAANNAFYRSRDSRYYRDISIREDIVVVCISRMGAFPGSVIIIVVVTDMDGEVNNDSAQCYFYSTLVFARPFFCVVALSTDTG